MRVTSGARITTFLAPERVVGRMGAYFSSRLSRVSVVLIPNLVGGKAGRVAGRLKVPAFGKSASKTSLTVILGLMNDVRLSRSGPTSGLVSRRGEGGTFRFVRGFRGSARGARELLRGPGGVLVEGLPMNRSFPVEMLSRVTGTPFLSGRTLVGGYRCFISSKTSVVSVKVTTNRSFSSGVPRLVSALHPVINSEPLDVSALGTGRVGITTRRNVSFILDLSLNGGSRIRRVLGRGKVPTMLLPAGFSRNGSPGSPSREIRTVRRLVGSARKLGCITSLVLSPMGDSDVIRSVVTYRRFRGMGPTPVFFNMNGIARLVSTSSKNIGILLTNVNVRLNMDVLFAPRRDKGAEKDMCRLSATSGVVFLTGREGSVPGSLNVGLITFGSGRGEGSVVLGRESKVPRAGRMGPVGFVESGTKDFGVGISCKAAMDSDGVATARFGGGDPSVMVMNRSTHRVCRRVVRGRLIAEVRRTTCLKTRLGGTRVTVVAKGRCMRSFRLFGGPSRFGG